MLSRKYLVALTAKVLCCKAKNRSAEDAQLAARNLLLRNPLARAEFRFAKFCSYTQSGSLREGGSFTAQSIQGSLESS